MLFLEALQTMYFLASHTEHLEHRGGVAMILELRFMKLADCTDS